MTARRSSATERRGVGTTPRPAALSAAALTVALAASGCASRNVNTAPTTVPLNQDTAAVAKDGGLPRPPGAAAHYIVPTVTAMPSTTNVVAVPPGCPAGAAATETCLGDTIKTQLTTNPLTVGLTPEQNPASPKPLLEVVGMPTWLWIEGLPPALQTTITDAATGHTDVITVQAAMDTVTWSTDSATGPTFHCGNGTQSPSPSKGYGVPYVPAFDPSASGVPNACVQVFNAPAYDGAGGAKTAAVYQLQAAVAWHIDCYVYDATTNTMSARAELPRANYSGTVTTQRTPIRVGEIQALAITP